MSWQVVILRRGGREEGPFSEEEVLDLLDAGQLTREDWCRVEGQPHEQRLGELFQTISPDPETKRAASPIETGSPAESSSGFFPDLARGGNRPVGATAASEEKIEPDSSEEIEALEEIEEFDEATDDEVDHEDETDEEAPVGDEPSAGDDAGYLGEDRLLFAGYPSWLNYWKSFALVASILVGGYWAGAFGGWWLGAAFAVAFLLMARAFVSRASHDYSISSERVECTHGLVSKTSREIRLEDIRAINVVESGLTGLLGVGTIIFSSVGGAEDDVVFAGVRRAHKLKELVRRWQRR